ncbi:MAG: hypothetical protein H6709_17905 [Kofleriaceae bacterium]|nr:hypothetical protein [Kofleriaceae bacterium]MCB9573959.1 hypothetical protein [Kofleriaceae bacterium]
MFRALPWRATAPLFRTSVLAALVAAVTTTAGCSGDGKGKGGGTGPGTATTTPIDAAVATPIDAGPRIEPVVVKPKIDHPPELELPAWQAVGVGQTISFSTAVIDQDLDETASRVTAMPASARFDALTQTVTWTPTKADMPAGKFQITASRPGDADHVTVWDFEIKVEKKKQPAPVAARQGAVVETLLTIREPDRLDRVNKDWPFDRFLVRSAELFRATLPPEVQTKLAKPDGKAMFQSFLIGMAQTHDNPRLDPTSKQFDKKSFGDPKSWKIVAVRPRIDKKWTELRVIYQATRAPEPVFAMFRVRPTWDVPTLPPEARAYNNKVFLDMVWRHLLDDGKPSDKLLAKPRDDSKAVAALVKEVLAYDDSKTNPWARAGFSALATEARMGGGSAREADGSYRSGDGWAWAAMKPLPDAVGTAQAYVNIGIPGFWTAVTASPDGTGWVGKCAPKFDPDDPKHTPGYEGLCRKAMGFVDLPLQVDGKIVSSKRDAVNLFVDHKLVDMVANLPLDDGRRDHGEENGMTCAQCHVRAFGVRDYGDAATADPRQGTPKAGNHAIDTLHFQIVPTERWQAFTLEFMQDQECKGAKAIEQFLGKPSGLTCPLQPQ